MAEGSRIWVARIRRRITRPLYIVILNLIHDPSIPFGSARLFQRDRPSTAGLRYMLNQIQHGSVCRWRLISQVPFDVGGLW